jgi:transcriptional regulator with XRE-family HTH domain
MLAEDRKRAGWSVEQAARRLGVTAVIYQEIEAGRRSPAGETWDRICKAFGWAQTFARATVVEPSSTGVNVRGGS